MNAQNIQWTRPTASGLGDRFVDLVYVGAYARARSTKVHLEWPVYTHERGHAAHRAIDIELGNVRKYIHFPPEIVFTGEPCAEKFPHSIGGGADPVTFHNAYLKDQCSYTEFVAYMDALAHGFSFCDEINAFTNALPARFAAVHIRRADKVRAVRSDQSMVATSELDYLNELTRKAIDYYIRSDFEHFFVCGDEGDKTAPFREYIDSNGGKLLSLPNMPQWQATYYDLAVLAKSATIAISNRNSSFSRFAAMVGGGICKTVFQMEQDRLI